MQSTDTDFLNVSPLIATRDIEEGIAFYRTALGFDLIHRGADPAQFAIVGRAGVRLHLFADLEEHRAAWTSLEIEVEGIDALYRRCQEKGCVDSNGSLALRSWGCREFSITDPSGVCITFAEPVTVSSSQEENLELSEKAFAEVNSAPFVDSELFQRFLESLGPYQASLLILSGALDNIIPIEEINTKGLDAAYPHPGERQGFDFEEWKNRPNPKIR